jgi:hypothetical protein
MRFRYLSRSDDFCKFKGIHRRQKRQRRTRRKVDRSHRRSWRCCAHRNHRRSCHRSQAPPREPDQRNPRGLHPSSRPRTRRRSSCLIRSSTRCAHGHLRGPRRRRHATQRVGLILLVRVISFHRFFIKLRRGSHGATNQGHCRRTFNGSPARSTRTRSTWRQTRHGVKPPPLPLPHSSLLPLPSRFVPSRIHLYLLFQSALSMIAEALYICKYLYSKKLKEANINMGEIPVTKISQNIFHVSLARKKFKI